MSTLFAIVLIAIIFVQTFGLWALWIYLLLVLLDIVLGLGVRQ